MKFVLNRCYGGFSLSTWALEQLGVKYTGDVDRDDNPDLIKLVEENAEKASGRHSKLKVIEIPDSTTDYELHEYDGFESITYVVDGKIHHA